MRTWALCAALLSASACGDPSPKEEPRPAPDAGVGISIASIAQKPLDALTPAESEMLCLEDLKKTDFCLWLGRYTQAGADPPDERACEDLVARCRQAAMTVPVGVDCAGVTIAAPGSCPVSVEQYLACVDASNATLTCANAGYKVPAPAACENVEKSCPTLAIFHGDGKPPPCPKDAGAGASPDTNDDIVGLDLCRPTPSRFVVLGDSIADCATVSDAECGPNLIADYIRGAYVPDLAFETHAVSGARIGDLPGQAEQVEAGPGHVFVWVYAIGNDLLVGNVDYPGWEAAWKQVFDRFQDPARFPDGATFLLNTQYTPYDECSSQALEALLREANQKVFLDVATARTDTVAIDQYPDWLGHGMHANDGTCAHCSADNTKWVFFDGVHPNALGYAHMAEKWSVAVDAMLGRNGECAGN